MFGRFYPIFLFMKLFFVEYKPCHYIHVIILGYTAWRQVRHNPLFTTDKALMLKNSTGVKAPVCGVRHCYRTLHDPMP